MPIAITLLAHQAEGEPTLETLYQRWQRERTEMLQRADAKNRLTNIELSYELSLYGPRMNDGAMLPRLLMQLASPSPSPT